MRADLPAALFSGLQSHRGGLLQAKDLPHGCMCSQPRYADGGHRQSTEHDLHIRCLGLLRALRLPGSGSISMTGALDLAIAVLGTFLDDTNFFRREVEQVINTSVQVRLQTHDLRCEPIT